MIRLIKWLWAKFRAKSTIDDKVVDAIAEVKEAISDTQALLAKYADAVVEFEQLAQRKFDEATDKMQQSQIFQTVSDAAATEARRAADIALKLKAAITG
jgi:hypothetical protein